MVKTKKFFYDGEEGESIKKIKQAKNHQNK